MDESPYDRLTDTLRRMTRRNRASLLRAIVQHIDTSDALYLLELVRNKLNFDPFQELPLELQMKVLSRIKDPLTLLRVALVCKRWNYRIFDDTTLWKNLIKRQKITGPLARRVSGVDDCIKAVKWQVTLSRNWQSASFTKKVTIPAHGASVITCLQLCENINRLISGADNGTVAVWELTTGKNLLLLGGHQGGVWALKASSDGLLVTGSTDRTLIVWDLFSGARKFDLVGHSSTIRCVEIIKKHIVSGSRDGTLRVWDSTNGHCLHILTGHTASVRCISRWSDKYMASGSYDHTIRVWDLETGRCIAVCQGHDGKIYSLASSSEYIFSGGIDAKIRVWKPLTGECIDVFSDHSALVGIMEIHGTTLVAGSTDGSISFWDVNTLQRIRHVEFAHQSSVTALDHNSTVLISGSTKQICLWSFAEIKSDEPIESILLSEKADMVWRISVGSEYAAMAYQLDGFTKIDLLTFTPN